MIISNPARLMTAEQFEAFTQRPENRGRRLELSGGRLIEWPSPGAETMPGGTGGRHGEIVVRLTLRLGAFIEAHHLGRMTGAETCYRWTTDEDAPTVRCPDFAFIRAGRAADPLPDGYLPFAPDLAVEVVSPNDEAEEVQEKVQDYLLGGVEQVWLVYPRTRQIFRFTPGGAQMYAGDDVIEAGPTLPGFALRASDAFPG